MKVAAAQIACVVGDIAANTEKIRAFAARAKEAGAELVVFPETSDIGYSLTTIKQLAVSLSQGAVPELKEIARQVSIVLVCGVCEREGDSIFNTQVVIAPAGEMVVKYRKTHLFSLSPFSESECFTAGKELTTHRIGDFIFGLSICYDFRFPELYRVLAIHKQANVLLNSSAHPFPRLDHLRAVVLARAIENQSYFVLANRVGTDGNLTFCGNSVIIDPYGVVIAAASAEREELITADISIDLLRWVRERMPVFANRRPELYC